MRVIYWDNNVLCSKTIKNANRVYCSPIGKYSYFAVTIDGTNERKQFSRPQYEIISVSSEIEMEQLTPAQEAYLLDEAKERHLEKKYGVDK